MKTFLISLFVVMAFGCLICGFDAGKQDSKVGIKDISIDGNTPSQLAKPDGVIQEIRLTDGYRTVGGVSMIGGKEDPLKKNVDTTEFPFWGNQ